MAVNPAFLRVVAKLGWHIEGIQRSRVRGDEEIIGADHATSGAQVRADVGVMFGRGFGKTQHGDVS